MTFYNWLKRREHGFKPRLGDEDLISRCIYNSFTPYSSWNNLEDRNFETGGVFNLEFSPEGSLLVAACQMKSIAIFDPMTTKHIKTIKNAHSDSVNCVKFLDNRLFATCSDDNTVALWDTRYLGKKIRSLHGHLNWVKNIDYSPRDGLLVTSGFDGSIYAWDINSYTEQGLIYQKVFHTSGLTRCRISPDTSKLVICTTGGYLIIIHDLDLKTLAKDLCGFKPIIYRLMQSGQQFIPQASKFEHVFSKSQKRNRVELISDFPEKNDAEVVCSLQIHPKGWCALSRNLSYNECSEWTCIHDIQERSEVKKTISETESCFPQKRKYSDRERDDLISSNAIRQNLNLYNSNNSENSAIRNRSTTNERFVPDLWVAEVTIQNRTYRALHNDGLSNAHALIYAISSGVIAQPTRQCNENHNQERANRSELPTENNIIDDDLAISVNNQKLYKNVRRLLYYTQEPNEAKSFIKEASFSSDGRIIFSPYKQGVRLLAFSDNCTDLSGSLDSSDSYQRKPELLKEIKIINSHTDTVVSTKFSPIYSLLVTGCLKGKIVWHHPVL